MFPTILRILSDSLCFMLSHTHAHVCHTRPRSRNSISIPLHRGRVPETARLCGQLLREHREFAPEGGDHVGLIPALSLRESKHRDGRG